MDKSRNNHTFMAWVEGFVGYFKRYAHSTRPPTGWRQNPKLNRRPILMKRSVSKLRSTASGTNLSIEHEGFRRNRVGPIGNNDERLAWFDHFTAMNFISETGLILNGDTDGNATVFGPDGIVAFTSGNSLRITSRKVRNERSAVAAVASAVTIAGKFNPLSESRIAPRPRKLQMQLHRLSGRVMQKHLPVREPQHPAIAFPKISGFLRLLNRN